MTLLDQVLVKAIPEFLRLRPRGSQLPEIVKAFRAWDKSLDKKRIYSVLYWLTVTPMRNGRKVRGKPGRPQTTMQAALIVDQLYRQQKESIGLVDWKELASQFRANEPAFAAALEEGNKQKLSKLLHQAHRRWCRPGNRRAKFAPQF